MRGWMNSRRSGRRGRYGLKAKMLSGKRKNFSGWRQSAEGFGNQESSFANVRQKDQAWLVWRPETPADFIEHQLYARYCVRC